MSREGVTYDGRVEVEEGSGEGRCMEVWKEVGGEGEWRCGEESVWIMEKGRCVVERNSGEG